MKVQVIVVPVGEAEAPEVEVVDYPDGRILSTETIPHILFQSKVQHVLDPSEKDNSIVYFRELCDNDDVAISEDGMRATVMGGDEYTTVLIVQED